MKIEMGMSFYGPNDARLIVAEIEKDRIRVVRALSLRETYMTAKELEDWASQSTRRVYYPPVFAERREKIFTGSRGDLQGSVENPDERIVAYRLPEEGGQLTIVPEDEWNTWRDALKD